MAAAARSAGGATSTAHRARVMAAVECPLGHEFVATCSGSQCSRRGWASACLSTCVVTPVTASRQATATARQPRRRASATAMHSRPAQA